MHEAYLVPDTLSTGVGLNLVTYKAGLSKNYVCMLTRPMMHNEWSSKLPSSANLQTTTESDSMTAAYQNSLVATTGNLCDRRMPRRAVLGR
jgi:hypothetical protein